MYFDENHKLYFWKLSDCKERIAQTNGEYMEYGAPQDPLDAFFLSRDRMPVLLVRRHPGASSYGRHKFPELLLSFKIDPGTSF